MITAALLGVDQVTVSWLTAKLMVRLAVRSVLALVAVTIVAVLATTVAVPTMLLPDTDSPVGRLALLKLTARPVAAVAASA